MLLSKQYRTDMRFDYTAIGDTVGNLASRLEGGNRSIAYSYNLSEFTASR